MSFDRVEASNEARQQYMQQIMQTYETGENKLQGRKTAYLKNNKDTQIDLFFAKVGALWEAVASSLVGPIVGGASGTPEGPPRLLSRATIGIPDGAVDRAICPLTQMPVIEGVRTPDGQLYEKSEIEQWVKTHGTNPQTRQNITLNDLIPDEIVTLESAKTFVKFLQDKREETKKIAPDLSSGYDVLITDTRESALSVHNMKLATLQKKWQNGHISYQELAKQIKELGEKYLTI